MIKLGRERLAHLDEGAGSEWLVANGAGSFASGTVPGLLTRRYHALLVASLPPPLGPVVLVRKVDLTARLEGPGEDFRLGVNEYHDGTVEPAGHRHLESFHLDLGLPVWRWALAECVLEQRVWMERGVHSTWIRLHHARGQRPIQLTVAPLCACRGFHDSSHGARDLGLSAVTGGFECSGFDGSVTCRMRTDQGRFVLDPDWHWGVRHRLERERGLDDCEDLLMPGRFELELEPGQSATLRISALTGTGEQEPPAGDPLLREHSRREDLLVLAGAAASGWTRTLVLAADAYLIERPAIEPVVDPAIADGSRAATGRAATGRASIIAGYPWFGDWGRDTMIALPGLATATGRHDDAARVLRSYAACVSEGMLPNRFPDRGEAPEFNTVDATLWWFQAAHAHIEATADDGLCAELWPTFVNVLDWHQRGTRFGIRMDPADRLLRAGEPGVQLTWMDARIGDWVVTPRIGKPVEINALWHGAHAVMTRFARRLGHDAESERYRLQAELIASNFRSRFWDAERERLYDVIDGPEGNPGAGGDSGRRDGTLRPNQILAASLPWALLDKPMAAAVVDAVAKELLTTYGLRSLGPREPGYRGCHQGGPRERDGAYHQGTVWGWLLGPFAIAHFHAYGDVAAARAYLLPMAEHLGHAGLGHVSEIFDGDPPHSPRGCFAQAWSVAETLRAWRLLAEHVS